MSQYQSLQARKVREITERNLIVILGTLILGGWFVLGIIFLEPPRGILRLLNHSVGPNAIFLVLIPYSTRLIIVRLINSNKNICVTKFQILSNEKFSKTFASAPQTLHLKAKINKTKLTKNWLRLSFATNGLFTASFLLGVACLSGFIGWQKAATTNIVIFLLSATIFCFQIYRILLIAADLVKIIRKSLK